MFIYTGKCNTNEPLWKLSFICDLLCPSIGWGAISIVHTHRHTQHYRFDTFLPLLLVKFVRAQWVLLANLFTRWSHVCNIFHLVNWTLGKTNSFNPPMKKLKPFFNVPVNMIYNHTLKFNFGITVFFATLCGHFIIFTFTAGKKSAAREFCMSWKVFRYSIIRLLVHLRDKGSVYGPKELWNNHFFVLQKEEA